MSYTQRPTKLALNIARIESLILNMSNETLTAESGYSPSERSGDRDNG